MTADLKIEKGVPMPIMANNARWAIVAKMEKGDSIFVEGKSPSGVSGQIAYAKRKFNFKFCARREGSGTRVWRIE